MVRKINDFQCALILCVATIGLNFLVFPALFAKYAYSDIYISVAIGLVIDFVLCSIVLRVMKNNPNVTFFQFVSRAMGKVVAIVLTMFMCIHLFIKGVLVVKEIHNYFNETLFNDIQWIIYVIPLLVFVGFIVLKNFRAYGRTMQFFVWLIVVAMVVSVVIPATQADFTNLLPLLENGSLGIWKGVFFCSFTFGDYLVLLTLMGRVEFRKNSISKISKWLIITDVLIVGFCVVFSAIFGDTGLNHSLALSEVLLYTSINTLTGSINWINILFWLVILFLQVGLFFLSSAKLMREALNIKSKAVVMAIVVGLLLLTVSLLYLNLIRAINIVISLPFIITDLSIQLLLLVVYIWSSIKTGKSRKMSLVSVFNRSIVKYQLTGITGVTADQKYTSVKAGEK